MGIFCEIKLAKKTEDEYKPGEVVSGAIKYALDKETTFKSVIMSIKGVGRLRAKDTVAKNQSIHTRTEIYVYIDKNVYKKESEVTFPVGAYEAEFDFKLPDNIPGSFKYNGSIKQYAVSCKIEYYLRIKFEKSCMLNFNKKFKKVITVGLAPMIPVLPIVPCTLGVRRKLVKLFPKPNIINLKAVIENSVLAPGDTAKVKYELDNDSNVTIKYVKTKLVETTKFILGKRLNISKDENVKLTNSKTGPVRGGVSWEGDYEVSIPDNLATFANSNLISRDYFIVIKIQMPVPYRNLLLRIPVQVGIAKDEAAVMEEHDNNPPPSYWEVMFEDKENDKGEND